MQLQRFFLDQVETAPRSWSSDFAQLQLHLAPPHQPDLLHSCSSGPGLHYGDALATTGTTGVVHHVASGGSDHQCGLHLRARTSFFGSATASMNHDEQVANGACSEHRKISRRRVSSTTSFCLTAAPGASSSSCAVPAAVDSEEHQHQHASSFDNTSATVSKSVRILRRSRSTSSHGGLHLHHKRELHTAFWIDGLIWLIKLPFSSGLDGIRGTGADSEGWKMTPFDSYSLSDPGTGQGSMPNFPSRLLTNKEIEGGGIPAGGMFGKSPGFLEKPPITTKKIMDAKMTAARYTPWGAVSNVVNDTVIVASDPELRKNFGKNWADRAGAGYKRDMKFLKENVVDPVAHEIEKAAKWSANYFTGLNLYDLETRAEEPVHEEDEAAAVADLPKVNEESQLNAAAVADFSEGVLRSAKYVAAASDAMSWGTSGLREGAQFEVGTGAEKVPRLYDGDFALMAGRQKLQVKARERAIAKAVEEGAITADQAKQIQPAGAIPAASKAITTDEMAEQEFQNQPAVRARVPQEMRIGNLDPVWPGNGGRGVRRGFCGLRRILQSGRAARVRTDDAVIYMIRTRKMKR
ncbi:unnamed protein product, partial [Amoebophrya sp. A120]|eukprot:GSA120T00016402001.1